jgi:hypothetical protein
VVATALAIYRSGPPSDVTGWWPRRIGHAFPAVIVGTAIREGSLSVSQDHLGESAAFSTLWARLAGAKPIGSPDHTSSVLERAFQCKECASAWWLGGATAAAYRGSNNIGPV